MSNVWFTIARSQNFYTSGKKCSKPYWKAKYFIQIWFRKIKCLLKSATEIFTDTVGYILKVAENFNSMAPIETTGVFSAKIWKNGKYTSIAKITYKYTSVAKITYTALICCVHWCKMKNKFSVMIHGLFCEYCNTSVSIITYIWLHDCFYLSDLAASKL